MLIITIILAATLATPPVEEQGIGHRFYKRENPNRQEEKKQAINPRTGEVYQRTGKGYINPRTGEYYAPAGKHLAIDPKTGETFPVR